MAKSQVDWADFRTPMYGENVPSKLKRLLNTAGMGDIDFEGTFSPYMGMRKSAQ